jgi:hypothetical protein
MSSVDGSRCGGQLEEPEDIPPAQRWEILSVEANPSARFGAELARLWGP